MKNLKLIAIILLLSNFGIIKNGQAKQPATSSPTPDKILYLPATLNIEDAEKGTRFHTINFSYNDNASIAGYVQTMSSMRVTWAFTYNDNGTLRSAANSQFGKNYTYSLSYDANNKLSKIEKKGDATDALNLEYNAASNTYTGSGGKHNGIVIKLNAARDLEEMQQWLGKLPINLTNNESKKGIFADVNLDESVSIFLNIYNGYNLDFSYFNKCQITRAVFNKKNYSFQQYKYDSIGYISSYITKSTATPELRKYSFTYQEQ